MQALQDTSRVQKVGTARYALIPKRIFDHLAWREDDRLAIKVMGTKLVIERIPFENLCNIKFATAEEGR